MKYAPQSLAVLALLSALSQPLLADEASATIDKLGVSGGPQAGETLAPYLDSDNAQHRWRAARALGRLGHQDAADKLVGLLDDSDPIVQLHAVVALGRIGDDSPETVEAIIQRVASPDTRIARASIAALRKLQPGPAKIAEAIEQVLQTEDQVVMTHVVDVLVDAGEQAAPLLQKMLEEEKAAYWAAVAISQIGPDAADAAPALAKAIERGNDASLHQELLAVAALGPAGDAAADAVRRVAESTDVDADRIAACYALGAIGDEDATQLLRRLKGSGGEFQRVVCAWSISKLHPNDPAAQQEALFLLTAALKSERPEVRDAAAQGLLLLEAPREKTAAALLGALDGASEEQKANIAAALAGLGPGVLDRAIQALDNPAMRDIAIEVIGRLGSEASEAAAPLADLLEDATPDQQKRINFALASIGASAGSQCKALTDCLASDDPGVRQSALFALRRMGPHASAAADALNRTLQGTDDQFDRLATAWALAAVSSGKASDAVQEVLQKGLAHQDAHIRFETVKAIGDLDAQGAAFGDKLRDLAETDPDPEVRLLASEVAALL